jgi:hypothetical protein
MSIQHAPSLSPKDLALLSALKLTARVRGVSTEEAIRVLSAALQSQVDAPDPTHDTHASNRKTNRWEVYRALADVARENLGALNAAGIPAKSSKKRFSPSQREPSRYWPGKPHDEARRQRLADPKKQRAAAAAAKQAREDRFLRSQGLLGGTRRRRRQKRGRARRRRKSRRR